MPSHTEEFGEAELRRIGRVKQINHPVPPAFGPELISFFKQSVQKRQTKLSQIAKCWAHLVPEMLNNHCSLEGLNRGTLTVIVDSASHLYELKQLLLAGLMDQLLLACGSAGLRKITLKKGQWYEGDSGTDRKLKF